MICQCRLYKCGIVLFYLCFGLGMGGHSDIPTTLVFPAYTHSYGIQRATPAKLFMLAGWKTRFNDPQGIACVKLKKLDDPQTEHDDDELTVYGINSGEHNIIYNKSMYFLGIYGKPGSGEGQFHFPKGITADEDGNVFVADWGNHRIVHLFFSNDRLLEWRNSIGSLGEKPGKFNHPTGIALDSKYRIYVSDTDNHRIQVFDSSLAFLFSLGKLGAFFLNKPTGIVVTDPDEIWSRYRQHPMIYCIDSLGQRLIGFNLETQQSFRSAFPISYPPHEFKYLALDYFNQVYVTDIKNHTIHKFDRDLNYLTSFGNQGLKDRQFVEPRGICIWRRYGQTFITEKEGAQYYWIGTDTSSFEYETKSQQVKIKLRLTEPTFLRITLVQRDSTMEKLFFSRHNPDGKFFQPSGVFETDWIIKKTLTGNCTLKIILEPTYSSYTYFSKVIERKVAF